MVVQGMSDGAYRGYHNLLMSQWQSSDGMLPSDDASLARLSGLFDRWKLFRKEILVTFEVTNGRLKNTRQFEEWERARQISEKKGKRAPDSVLTQDAMRTDSGVTQSSIRTHARVVVPVDVSVLPKEQSEDADEAPREGIVAEIVCAHPKSIARQLQPNRVGQREMVAVIEAIQAECEAASCSPQEAAEMILERTQMFSEKIPRGEWRYLKDVAEFYRLCEYRREPEEFIHTQNGDKYAQAERESDEILKRRLAERDRGN